MAIDIRETFEVTAPVETVWKFVMDPAKVVSCMPGAQLDETVDERNFLGRVKVKVGAVTSGYKGKVRFTEVDESSHTVRMLAEGRETGGGTAKGTVSSILGALPDGRTEVVVEANIDLTGRIMQVGRGMIQGVSSQLFRQFAANVKQQLEACAAAADGAAGATATLPPVPQNQPIRVLPLLLKTLWAAITRFFRPSGRSQT